MITRPLILSTEVGIGGAGIAAHRLHLALKRMGVASRIFCQNSPNGLDPEQVCRQRGAFARLRALAKPVLDNLPQNLLRKPNDFFHLQWLPDPWQRSPLSFGAELLHLHWICAGFLRIEALGRWNLPLVWTLHDMWPFTGGCHYAGECDRYRERCGRCPVLQSRHEHDCSRWIWRRKHRAWRVLDLTVVTPSRWLAECAAKSSLFTDRRIEVIHNGVDLRVFKPIPRDQARHILGLPQDKRLILFGFLSGSASRKGKHYLEQCLATLADEKNRVELAVFGNVPPTGAVAPFTVHNLGILGDEVTLALAYSAADLFLCPSEQDNLPNTVVEALACGTPCLAFDIGGMRDLIVPGKTGFLARPFDVAELAGAVRRLIGDEPMREGMSRAARERAERYFSATAMAENYLRLYGEVAGRLPGHREARR